MGPDIAIEWLLGLVAFLVLISVPFGLFSKLKAAQDKSVDEQIVKRTKELEEKVKEREKVLEDKFRDRENAMNLKMQEQKMRLDSLVQNAVTREEFVALQGKLDTIASRLDDLRDLLRGLKDDG